MKHKNKPHFVIMATIVAVFAALTWSCNKDDDPSLADLREDKLKYLEDSLRISDSLKRINAAGIVNYAITIVDGSTSSLYKNPTGAGRSEATQSTIEGAIVTISQYGKTVTDTTDASGMVVFNGFFRTSVNVSVRREGFTTASYVAVTSVTQPTANNSISFVGNVVPIFATTGPNTATISGRATIQTNLTNKTRELVPDGTTVVATIDTKDPSFATKFLTAGTDNLHELLSSSCGCTLLVLGEILEASYATTVVGSVASGNYSITVPASADGLPIKLQYSDVAADQTMFEYTGDADPFDRTVTYRTIFEASAYTPSSINAAGGVTVAFDAGSGAQATAVLTLPETIDRINVTNGGSGYTGTPAVTITGGGGTGATASAVVTNGVITAINLTNPGTGYNNAGTLSVNIISGTGALASSTLAVNGTVTGVAISNTGAGYTTAPTVTFSAPGGTGTVATGTATIDAAGRVTGVTITDAGSGYTADPTVAFSAAPAGGVTATGNGIYSGRSVASVAITNAGANYTYAPSVTFSLPQRANGVQATGTAQFDPASRQVTGIIITNAGSGYTAAPTVTLNAGSNAAAQALLTGGSVLSVNVTNQGSNYVAPPVVVFESSDGSGATGTAVIADGKLIGINVTNPGSGYINIPTIQILSGTGAQAFASVVDGGVSGVTIVNGGSHYTGAPVVTFTATGGVGGGATGTATVAGGQVTGVTIGNAGTGYIEGNVPSGAGETFAATKGTIINTQTGVQYINDVHYGTGVRQPN